jgi:hypothetical protein
VLPSLVIKIEYCRALHRGSKEPSRLDSLSCLPALEKAPISRFPATKKPSISTFAAAFLTETASHSEIAVTHSKQTGETFLTETRIAHSASLYPEPLRRGMFSRDAHFGSRTVHRDAPLGLRQGTVFYPELRRAAVPSLVCLHEKRGIQLNYSFRAASSARASGCAVSSGPTNVNLGPFPTGFPGGFFATYPVRSRPFLTGSAPQTELAVTHSKQTTGQFLTGARTHIKEFANPHSSDPENLLLHRRPIQIFLRPTI